MGRLFYGAQTSTTVKQPPHDLLSITAAAKEAGYAYVFVSNEHPYAVDVYADDVTVTQTPSQIVGSSDYYPFGLTFNSYSRENSTPNQYKFNGKEEQDELGLGWLDYIARQYDPAIGRFTSVDPAANLMRRLSPYAYSYDNPIRFTDPDGMIPSDMIDPQKDCLGCAGPANNPISKPCDGCNGPQGKDGSGGDEISNKKGFTWPWNTSGAQKPNGGGIRQTILSFLSDGVKGFFKNLFKKSKAFNKNIDNQNKTPIQVEGSQTERQGSGDLDFGETNPEYNPEGTGDGNPDATTVQTQEGGQTVVTNPSKKPDVKVENFPADPSELSSDTTFFQRGDDNAQNGQIVKGWRLKSNPSVQRTDTIIIKKK